MFKKILLFILWVVIIFSILIVCFISGSLIGLNTSKIIFLWLLLVFVAFTFVTIFSKREAVFLWFRKKILFKKNRMTRYDHALRASWIKGLSVLKRAGRKRKDYAWYMLMAEPGSATSLLDGAGLTLHGNDTKGRHSTNTLHWFFFNSIAFLDVSCFSFPGQPRLMTGWENLIRWIPRRYAPSGVIICISIQDLVNNDASALREKAREINKKIKHLSLRFSSHFTYQLCITDCDEYPGFSLWADQLSEKQQRQALGYLWHENKLTINSDETALEPFFEILKKAFDYVRLSNKLPAVSQSDQTALNSFPEEFFTVKEPLETFTGTLFEKNMYSPDIALYAMWLTARLQTDDKILTPPTIFVQDLIENILPESSKLKPLKKRQSNTLIYCLSLMMLTGILIWFIYSATRSYHLIQPVADNDSLNVLAKKMLVNETRAGSSLTFLPFSWVLNYQHKQLSVAMAKKNINAIFDVKTVVKQVQDDIERLPVSRKRDRIIELAHLINTISDIQKGASTLKTDHSFTDIVLTNLYGDKTNTYQPEQRVIAHQFLIGREGDKYVRSLQNVLKKFIVREAFPQWFFVPHKSLNDISSSRYWPDMPEESELSGIWTRDGEKQIAKWVETLKAAADNETGTILDKMYHDLPLQRQQAWKAWLFNTNTLLKRQQGMKLTSAELSQIMEGKSPSFRLIDSVVKDLETVPDELTQPWLRDFRHVQHISSFASPTQNALPFFRADQKLHHRVSTYFKDDNSPASPKVLSQIDTFIAWREATNQAANGALYGIASGSRSDNSSASLAVNRLSDGVLATLFSQFVKLQESLRGEEGMQDRDMLWGLLENDAHRLVGNGLYDIGCWLNQEWKKSVYWPAIRPTKNQEYNALLQQTWSSILAFLKGPAKGLLTYESQGIQGMRFYNETVPYAPDFLALINDSFAFAFTQDDPSKSYINVSERQAILEEKIAERLLQQNEIGQGIQPVNIVSLPVSLPDPGRVLPVGINLSLICENGVTSFESINFAQTRSFTWYPGKCRRVTLSVKFPGFTAGYSYSGQAAWPDFIKEFISGEALIERERFTHNRKLLEEMNIDNILIRYQLDNINELLDSWAQWRQLEDEIIALKSERQSIIEARDQKPWRALKGKLSALPEKITYCE